MPSRKKTSRFLDARAAARMLAVATSIICHPAAMAQATARACDADGSKEEQAGPACLLAHEKLGTVSDDAVYWNLRTYPTADAANEDRGAVGSVVKAYGKIWLFTVGPLSARPSHGQHVADIGPIAVNKNTPYDAEFLKSTFSPGMTAPLHVHSGPEAFYALSGDTCLETPDGVQMGRGPGNSLMVRGGPPMLLMALGTETRRGFALILHDPARPPTTLIHDWKPKGLCRLD